MPSNIFNKKERKKKEMKQKNLQNVGNVVHRIQSPDKKLVQIIV